MIYFACILYASVATALPVGHGASFLQSSASRGSSAAAKIAPQTPPPGASCSLAAFTTASTSILVTSPFTTTLKAILIPPLPVSIYFTDHFMSSVQSPVTKHIAKSKYSRTDLIIQKIDDRMICRMQCRSGKSIDRCDRQPEA